MSIVVWLTFSELRRPEHCCYSAGTCLKGYYDWQRVLFNASTRTVVFSWPIWIRKRKKNFSSRVNFVCWLVLDVCSAPELLQWHVKKSGHSAKSEDGMLHWYTLDPTKSGWADYAAVQAQCGNQLGNELTCNLTGNIQPQSSQVTELLWTDPGLKSGIRVCELISTLKKKKAQVRNE